MNVLDRYIFKSVLFSCTAAVAVFAFVLAVGNFVRDLLSLVLGGQLNVFSPMFVHLLMLLVPFVVSYALPMGVLTGVLLTLGRLSADSEVTAMRSVGISPWRVARPVLLLAALGAAADLYVNFESMPRVRVEYDQDLSEIVRTNPLSFIVPKAFNRNYPGFVIYVGEKQGSYLSDFWVWALDDQKRVVKFLRADSGRLDYDEKKDEFVVTLTNAKVQTMDPNNPEDFSESPPLATFAQSDPFHLPLNRVLGRISGRRKVAWMTYEELQSEKLRLGRMEVPPDQRIEHERAQMKVALTIQDKITTALAVFSFAVIGIPLGIKVSRRETTANLGVAVALALGYYFLTVMVSWLDQHPEYRPDILIWLPNLVLIGTGLWLFRRIDRT